MPVMPTKGDDAVGYGNPPKHSQFGKGRSGNPKGRPKGTRNIGQVFRNELNRRIPITENGKHQTITKLEATIKQMVNKAASGDARAIKTLLQLSRELGDLELSTIAESFEFTLKICNLPKGLQDKKP
jgi:hypothetical protein